MQIGRLQRHACDAFSDVGFDFFEPGAPTGKRVAIVGSGPAGLSCADALRRMGHDVTVFEARSVPGGLDTLGIAAYKISTEFALAEIEMIRRIGIDIEFDHRVSAAELQMMFKSFDAVFLGIGLGKTHPLAIEGEDLDGVWEALDFIFQTHTRPLDRVHGRIARGGHWRGQHGHRRGDGLEAARGPIGDDHVPPNRGTSARLRLRI